MKKSGHQEVLFGEASLEWTKILLSENQKSDLSLIVKCEAKNFVAGKLKIRAKIGDGNEVALKKDRVPQNIKPHITDVSQERIVERASPEVQIVEDSSNQLKASTTSRAPSKVC